MTDKELREALKLSEIPDAEKMARRVSPAITRQAARLREKRERRSQVLLLCASALLFLVGVALALLLDLPRHYLILAGPALCLLTSPLIAYNAERTKQYENQ